MSSDYVMTCRCERGLDPGIECSLCMGRECKNETYWCRGERFHLIKATSLWSLGRYDGPISGIAVHAGLPCYYKCFTFYRGRSYWLFPLRVREWEAELASHAKWLSDISSVGEIESHNKRYAAGRPIGGL